MWGVVRAGMSHGWVGGGLRGGMQGLKYWPKSADRAQKDKGLKALW